MNSLDSSLQSPQEANEQKHINFAETEDGGTVSSQPSAKDDQSLAKEQWKEMREERMNNDQDPSLQSPQDANTQKHINFLEIEDTGTVPSPSSNEDDQNSAKEQWKEMREERMNNDQPL